MADGTSDEELATAEFATCAVTEHYDGVLGHRFEPDEFFPGKTSCVYCGAPGAAFPQAQYGVPLRDFAAMMEIAAERRRQVDVKGWTPEHDDQHRSGQLADAAARYAAAGGGTFPDERTAFLWPWAASEWKPSPDPRRNLVKAAALMVAEIERLDRRDWEELLASDPDFDRDFKEAKDREAEL